MVGVFSHCWIRKHPAALPGGYLPLWSVLCWEVTTPAQAGLGSYCGKSRQPRKATCTRKQEITRFKQLFLHRLSFKTHSSILNSVTALIPEQLEWQPSIRVVAPLVVPFPPAHCSLYTCATHSLDVEAFPMDWGKFQTLRAGQCCAAFVGRWVFCDRSCSEHRLPDYSWPARPSSWQSCPHFSHVLWP